MNKVPSPANFAKRTGAAFSALALAVAASGSALAASGEAPHKKVHLEFVEPKYDKHSHCYHEAKPVRTEGNRIGYLAILFCQGMHERKTIASQITVLKPNGDYFWPHGHGMTVYVGQGHTEDGSYRFVEEMFPKPYIEHFVELGYDVIASAQYNTNGPHGNQGADSIVADQHITAKYFVPAT